MKTYHKSSRILSYAALWSALFLWGIHGPSARYLSMDNISLLGVAESRFLIGTLILILYLIFSKKFIFLLKNHFINLFILSFIGLFLNSLTYHLGLDYIPATLVMLLENLAPFFVLFFAYFFDGKKPKISSILALSASFFGLILIAGGRGGMNIGKSDFYKGILLEILAGITFGFYTYYSGKVYEKIDVYYKKTNLEKPDSMTLILNVLFSIYLISSIMGLPLLLTFRKTVFSGIDIILIAQMGIFESGLAYILWNYAIVKIGSGKTSIFFYMTVVFTLINETLFLGFRPGISLIFGGIIILGSALYLTLSKDKNSGAAKS